jgi:acrylyl-CoA reductase (NADPH)
LLRLKFVFFERSIKILLNSTADRAMNTFKAITISKEDTGSQNVAYRDMMDTDLMDGNVDVRVSHSTINYKDGLVLSGKSAVVRKFPMIAGIDFAGVIERSTHRDFKPGDRVLQNGFGLSETHYGGYSQKVRVNGDWLVKIPEQFSELDAMAIGTAGYTAMLSVLALERHGLRPSEGPVVVTGAAGGVGSIAISILSHLGWHVIASTGRLQESEYLKEIGAAEVIDRKELSAPGRPLGKERWIAGVDSVGSHTLANVLAMTKAGGAVTACGLAQGMDLPASVAPFILRGVSLLGIDSVNCPMPRRVDAWNRLAKDLDLAKLHSMTTVIPFDQVVDTAPLILNGEIRGRIVVKIS